MSGRKKLLLISPSISNMYQDIIVQLGLFGVDADYIEDRGNPKDPDYIRYNIDVEKRENGRSKYDIDNAEKWKSLLESEQYNKTYDYLLVIDGMSINSSIFSILKSRNNAIYCVNYLYDSTLSLYRFQKNFKYFDRVFSFDKRDCATYNLTLLPIYWVDTDTSTQEYKFFGMGTYSRERYNLYKSISDYSQKRGMNSYIKIFQRKVKNYGLFVLRYIVKYLKGDRNYISPQIYNSNIVTHNCLSSSEFRDILNKSEIIIDSVNFEQDGLTARCMWALGLGKKIITNNENIINYPFYDNNQVLVLDKQENVSDKTLDEFLDRKFIISESISEPLINLRIDNWLKTMLNIL